jgi:serpin B
MKLHPSVPLSLLTFALLHCGAESAGPPPAVPAPTTAQPPVMASPVASDPAPAAANTGADPTTRDPAKAAALATSTPVNDFSASMYRALHGEKGNLFFSGESLRAALGMTALGAKGKTLDEMAKALGEDPDPAKNVAAAKSEADAWKRAAGKAELSIANRLFVANGFPVEKAFLTEADAGYGAAAAKTDFVGAPEPSRLTINGWVENATKGKIKDLLPPGSVTTTTRVVLTNAIYFKGSWALAFAKSDTKDAPFQTDAGATNVPTMHKVDRIRYGENDDVRVAELPYKDSDLTMLVALPQRPELLGAIEEHLTGAQIDGWAKGAQEAKVYLAMPRFTFTWGRSVKPELAALGIKTAFTGDADFSALSVPKGEPFYVSDVFHKAFVKVDETGTEAAAATGVVVAVRATAMEQVVTLKLDRPFLFFVRNGKTGDVLFSGRVANPRD